MDFVLFVLCGFCFAKGCLKGCLSMLFSFVGTAFAAVVSWQSCQAVAQVFSPFLLAPMQKFLSNIISAAIPGSFSALDELQNAILKGPFGKTFGNFFADLIENLSFEGSLSAGEILSASISQILMKVVAFAIVFVVLLLMLKVLKILVNRLLGACGLGWGNRLLGGALGILKGLVLFAVLYVFLLNVGNAFLNEGLTNFVKSGTVSNFLFDKILKTIDIFH